MRPPKVDDGLIGSAQFARLAGVSLRYLVSVTRTGIVKSVGRGPRNSHLYDEKYARRVAPLLNTYCRLSSVRAQRLKRGARPTFCSPHSAIQGTAIAA